MDSKYKSYVYIFPLSDKTYYKIGKTDNPEKRISELIVVHNIEISESIIYECSCSKEAYEIESVLHTIFSGDRTCVNGDGGTEFFKYSSFDKCCKIIKDIAEHRNFTRKKIYLSDDFKITNDEICKETNRLLSIIGLAIKARRLFVDMSQEELATLCGISRKTIITIEDSGNASFSNIVKVLVALEIDNIISLEEGDLVERKRASKNCFKII